MGENLRKARVRDTRLIGSVAMTLVGLVAVNAPGTYLGAADVLTSAGMAYSLALVLAATLFAGIRWRGPWARWAVLATIACNTGIFVPALPEDPTIGSLVIGWQLLVLGLELFGVRAGVHRRLSDPSPEPDQVAMRGAAKHLTFVGILLTFVVVGYGISASPLVGVVSLATVLFPMWVALRQMSRTPAMVPMAIGVAAALVIIVLVGGISWSIGLGSAFNTLMVAREMIRGEVGRDLLRSFVSNPALLIIVTFAGLIAAGALLLTLPAASGGGTPLTPIDALFTATSAVCVTGLIVRDTASGFSDFGLVVIMMLIQVGGLGIMVLSTFATLLVGSRLGLRGERALGEMLDLHEPASAYRLVKFIVVTTFSLELAGALALTWRFHAHGSAWGKAAWFGVFHAISAFCNAGFALYPDSLVSFADDEVVLLTHMALITFGGLGFVVLAALWKRWVLREVRRLDLHSRIALISSGALFLAGTILFAALEWNDSLRAANPSMMGRIWNAAMQSVTLRTAGFNSVEFTHLHSATVLFMIVWMFIGASPGGTGGGIKTTTFAVLIATVRGMLRGRTVTEIFGWEVPQRTVYRSAAISLLTALFLLAAVFLLLLSEPQIGFGRASFEAASALGTVGLSLGVTAGLSPVGKATIIATMFAGRVGPVTLALMLSRRQRSRRSLPRASIMVG